MDKPLPMDRFFDSYGPAFKKVAHVAEAMDPLSYEDQMEYAKVCIELQMVTGAVATAVSSRHSLSKKILDAMR
ncbi:hypothetical protein J2W35_004186 [Variovorax boronicumulans]|uniref:hypothetical protein n=1 Tax=Variovorax boronicumulans TaxID=436515 RepID=UPI0027866B27|nr:hypothetical protein [Variovorax boronicumulans]MDQ0083820.1 hypothetical protein [Variovorax boronicumulans]